MFAFFVNKSRIFDVKMLVLFFEKFVEFLISFDFFAVINWAVFSSVWVLVRVKNSWNHRLSYDSHSHVVNKGSDYGMKSLHSVFVYLVQSEYVIAHCWVAWVLFRHVVSEV